MKMKKVMKSEKFETADIALAAFLYCSGAHLSGIDKQNPHRCIFIFKSSKPELISKWQEGKATVNALAFYNAYQELKARLFRDGA